MKKTILLGVLLASLFLIVGCQQQVVCNKPYILVGTECCLDSNNNGICDRDETKVISSETTNVTIPSTSKLDLECPSGYRESTSDSRQCFKFQIYRVSEGSQVNAGDIFFKKETISTTMGNNAILTLGTSVIRTTGNVNENTIEFVRFPGQDPTIIHFTNQGEKNVWSTEEGTVTISWCGTVSNMLCLLIEPQTDGFWKEDLV